MTTEAFLGSFKRFISRRGLPVKIFCDNGSNFKGASNKLNELYKLFSNKSNCDQISDYCANKGVTFSFIPSYSPVFGALWEAAVKSCKFHFKRIMKDSLFTYEEFYTIISQVEAILNSRPLTPMTRDPTDFTYLTPGHFLTGRPLTSYPETDVTNIPQGRLRFWNQCVRVQQSFWKVWHKLYLCQLQSRPKWKQSVPNLEIDQLVLLKSDNISPFNWPVARIVKTCPGADGRVRVVEVTVPNGKTFLRGIHSIAMFSFYDV